MAKAFLSFLIALNCSSVWAAESTSTILRNAARAAKGRVCVLTTFASGESAGMSYVKLSCNGNAILPAEYGQEHNRGVGDALSIMMSELIEKGYTLHPVSKDDTYIFIKN